MSLSDRYDKIRYRLIVLVRQRLFVGPVRQKLKRSLNVAFFYVLKKIENTKVALSDLFSSRENEHE